MGIVPFRNPSSNILFPYSGCGRQQFIKLLAMGFCSHLMRENSRILNLGAIVYLEKKRHIFETGSDCASMTDLNLLYAGLEPHLCLLVVVIKVVCHHVWPNLEIIYQRVENIDS